MRLRRALDEFIVDGIDTTIPLFQTLVRNADIQNGLYDIIGWRGFLHWAEWTRRAREVDQRATAARA